MLKKLTVSGREDLVACSSHPPSHLNCHIREYSIHRRQILQSAKINCGKWQDNYGAYRQMRECKKRQEMLRMRLRPRNNISKKQSTVT